MRLRTILFALLIFCGAGNLSGYSQTAELKIEVTDNNAVPLVADCKLTGILSNLERQFQTNAQGIYIIQDLPLGRYRLQVNKTGFGTQTILLAVQTTAPMVRSIKLAPGTIEYKVDIVGTTPLTGTETDPDEIAAAVQTGSKLDFSNRLAINLADGLNRKFNAVNVNELQGNPFQPDVNYRGYSASPLLGTPQGLSLFLDGVKLNQPFGDVVSWDLIPQNAISEMSLLPGSNPLFGLNTLGGAISIQTKDGNTAPGTTLSLSGGSFGRKMLDFEHGGANQRGLHWFLANSMFFEDGWRESSPSSVRQFFGKFGINRERTAVDLTVAFANNSLTGNGMQEQRFLERNYRSIYTKPDITNNRSPFTNLKWRQNLAQHVLFSGNVYYRSIRTGTLNGDVNDESLEQSLYQLSDDDQAALTAAGYKGFPTSGANANNTPFPFWRCIAQVLQQDEPSEKCNGLLNRSGSYQSNYGAAGQLMWWGFPRGNRNQLTIGMAYDRSRISFQQSTQLGYINPDRSISGLEAFGDGITGGEADGEPFDTRVNLHGTIQTFSAYASNTYALKNQFTLTVSGRFNQTQIDNRDLISPLPGNGSLTGNHTFRRFNPAVSLTYRPNRFFNSYVSYTEGSRAPTSIELGCSDPEYPCKLPNAMTSDPPLDQVITRTLEAGIRSSQEAKLNWSFGFFRGENRNDLLFVSSDQTGFGYFKNFGKTRRQGFEADFNTRLRRVSIGAGYTYLQATYQSAELVNGTGNSTNNSAIKGIEGTININPGNHIPLIPSSLFKLYSDYQATDKLTLNLSVLAVSKSFARGNENNAHQPDGNYYLGAGHAPGYGIANFGAVYQAHRKVEFFVRLNNVFDRKYYTAAQLGPTAFTAKGNFIARPFPEVDDEYPLQNATFYAPGAPRAIFGGMTLRF